MTSRSSVPSKWEGGVVVCGEAGWEHAVADEARIGRPTLGLAVVVRAEAAGEEAEPAAELAQAWPIRIGDGVLEPAVRARAPAGEDGTAFPGLPKCQVDAVHTPDREHVRRVAAADVDHVLRGDLCRGIFGRPEQLEMRRPAGAVAECVVEALEVLRLVRRGGSDEADPRA
jgi:hypothetical protein